MFLKSAFRQFSCQSLPELDVFCNSHEEWPNCSLLWKFGLNIQQDGVLVTVFVSHSFSCFNDLKMGNTISMATRMVSFDLVFHKLSENVSFVDLQQGEHGFSFWMGIPSQKSETYEPPWNPNHGFHGNQSCVKRFIFGQAFRKSLLEWILRRVTGFLLGGHNVPPPLGFWSPKKAWFG